MKENKIVKKESVNGGSMFTLTFALPVSGFDFEQQVGHVLNSSGRTVNTTGTDLEVGDAITDDFGGEPVISSTHSNVESVEIRANVAVDYRDAFAQKQSGKGEK